MVKKAHSLLQKWHLVGVAILLVVAAFFIVSRIPKKPELGFSRQLFNPGEFRSTIPNVLDATISRSEKQVEVVVKRENVSLAFQLPLEGTKIKESENLLAFSSPNGTITTEYSMRRDGLKENIILNKIPQENTFPSTLKTEGLITKISAEGIPVFFDKNNIYQFHFERPYVKDAAGAVSYAVSYRVVGQEEENINKTQEQFATELLSRLTTITQSGQSYVMQVVVDTTWLHDPKRVLPITIDPTVVHNTSSTFATGTLDNTYDSGSGSSPILASGYQELATDSNTIGLWHMNEASGNILDSSGNGNTGVPTGTSVVSGKLGNARNFNGTTDRIIVADSLSFTTPYTTIEAWVNFTALGAANRLLMGKGAEEWITFNGTAWGCVANQIGFMVYTASSTWICTSSGFTPNLNQWYHLAGVYDGTQVKLYIDGIQVSAANNTSRAAHAVSSFDIGDYSGGGYGNPIIIDEVRFSNIARTPEDIKASASRRSYATYTSPVIDLGTKATSWSGISWIESGVATGYGETPYSSTGLVAQWNMNERGTATAANYAGTCGANCNATLTGFSNTNGPDLVGGSGWTAQNQRWGAGAIMFDGIDDNVSIPNSSTLNLSTFTYSAWVNIKSFAARNTIIDGGGAANTPRFGTETTTGLFNLYKSGVVILCSSSKPPQLNEWTHVVVTYDGTTCNIFQNGILDKTTTSANTFTYSAITRNIGSTYGSAEFFNGIIDSVQVYSRILPPSEILSNYNATNIEFQTRVGNTADPTDGTWEEWKPTTYESPLESFDSVTDIATRVYSSNIGGIGDNQTWHKKNNTVPAASDTTSTDGRLPLGSDGRGDDTHAYYATVIKDGSTYKMWYSGHDGTNIRIYYATSPDGLTWTKYDNTIPAASDTSSTNGRIPLGTAGKGDSLHAQSPTVVKDSSVYKMWYAGSDGTNTRIYYATSPDGLTWTKYDNTIPAASDTSSTNGRIPLGTAGKGDDLNAHLPTVIKDDSTYKMWYSGHDGATWRIYYATSPDGLTWTKYDNTIPAASDTSSTNGRIPLGNTGTADSLHTYIPVVLKDGSTYKMWYTMHMGNTRIGYATSPDGLTWTKYDNSIESVSDNTGTNGRLPLGNTGKGDQTHTYAPAIIKDGDIYKMWYSGNDSANWRIYYATMTPNSTTHENDGNFKSEGAYSKKLTSGSNKVDTSTIALWHLDETGGTGAYLHDSSSTVLHGTPTGTTLTKGVVGNARSFTGTDTINFGNISLIDNLANVTVEAWVYPKAQTAATHFRVFTEQLVLYVGQYGNQISFYMGDGTAWLLADATGGTLPINTWSHVAWVKSSTNYYIYLNGRLIKSGSGAPATLGTSANNTAISTNGAGAQPWTGLIDEVRISNAARTSEEIDEAYRLGRDTHVNYSISTADVSLKTTLPFSIAADRPGTYLSATLGESEFANYQPDDNTVALWHLDENISEYPRSCYTLRLNGTTTSGVYYIDPDGMGGNAPLQVYCNMTYDGGGWTMIVKSWYGSGLIGKSAAVGAVTDATTLMGNPYKLSDQNIRNIIGTSDNYDIMVDQNGYNSLYSTGNYEYVIIRNYTAPWTYEKAVAASSTTTVFESHRISDQALAWTGNLSCGYDANIGVAGINCVTLVTGNPQGGAGCTINMGTTSNAGWHHFFMNQYNDDTYLYMCNGAQHSSGQSMNHRFWVRERYPVTAVAKNSTKNGGNAPNLITATGGTITNANGYTIHTFTGSGDFTITGGSGMVEALVVAGGGGGANTGSGGGGGGYVNSLLFMTPGVYPVTVGSGGSGGLTTAAPGVKGGNSVFSTITAEGGGAGVSHGGCAGGNGGSGGGGPISTTCTATGGTGSQGGAGGAGFLDAGWAGTSGGGGGAGAAGTAGGNTAGVGAGGTGKRNGITGAVVTYAGGGGGGEVNGSYVGAGGAGGGGTAVLNAAGGSGTPNTGGGGAGGSYTGTYFNGGNGGSGIVIVRYPNLTFVNNKASAVVGATSVQGKIGKARSFDGTDYVNLNNPLSLQTTGSQTIDMWVYPTDLTARRNPYAKAYGGEGTITQETNGTLSYYYGTSGANAAPYTGFGSGGVITANRWNHIAVVRDLNGMKVNWYINGVMTSSATAPYAAATASTLNAYIGKGYVENYIGSIDEVRISNVARTADEIRQAYEVGLRSHSITINFGAKLDAGNLIANSGDLSFTVDATTYGLNQKGSNLYPEDKIIVRENYDGTEYTAQGTVTSVNPSTGAVTVRAWDGGGTFPTGGYTANADVFKWQKEYWNITASQSIHRNATDLLTLRFTDGNEARTVWIDDLKSSGGYLSNAAGSSIASSLGDRYFQYRTIFHSSDEAVSANLTSVTLNYNANIAPSVPTLDSPVNGATGVSRNPVLQTTTTDINIDYLRYKIELCTDLAMTTGCQTFDQTSSQTGWSGQNTETNTAYVSGMQASYTLATPLNYNSTYYWRSYAIDPNGTNVWTSTQGAPFSFTTLAVEAASSCKMTRTNNTTNTIEWVDVSGNEAGYRIQRNVNNGGWVDLDASLNPNTVSYVDNTVQMNNSYQYRVASFIAGPQYSTWCTTQTQSISEGVLQFGGGFSFSGITIQ